LRVTSVDLPLTRPMPRTWSESWLYPSPRELRKGGDAVFVDRNLKGRLYEELDRHWVTVTGLVNANGRGPLGVPVCEIKLERIEPLPYAPLPDPYIHGVFRNDTSITIDLKLSSPSGYAYKLNVLPGEVTGAAVITKGSITASTRAGKLLAKGNLVPANSQRYFDAATRTYYYRIAPGNVELVSPTEAKAWKAAH